MQPIDLLAHYRENLHDIAFKERRDPDFCRMALQLCRDLPYGTPEELEILDRAIFSILKQANWPKKGLFRLLGPTWLSYDMAHSTLGPFRDRDKILHLAGSISRTAKHYHLQLFGNHSSVSCNQRQFKVAVLFICIAIDYGITESAFASLPQLGP